MKPAIFLLTCANESEADKIIKCLLEKRLIVCAKKFSVDSTFYWKSTIKNAKEIMLIMESDESKFDKVEQEVRKIHSYETFVLELIPVSKISRGVKEWLKESL
ncbi:MAG TPA: divalent cation tolerance protein CutA [Patescibacteria group bacterium]|nr:divalent cation tolerance protein CutA [Patescibacteria group bacterium]